ncbi:MULTISPECIES: hypothetical protein [Paenibacillus]|uniref:hypothetical protein n=1 Tax=Paenibacillus TaxID=44249 RepID=UPI000406CBC6|nr:MULTISPECIES: hypothetical protein [Paenibacillus]MDN4078179.1 hypothetical protein [Paenibacillus polymyxa]MDN4103600.1 hypothetical protein [Paenibacillus polymyxa]MDN4113767.1 hypothetical protein [Paenibacillus polymyxa]UMY55345.1 hypothetical protein MLD56_02485 [Paenibacillus peoriae]
MNNKSKVQNPLTIIAIFAGIAELAGTTVLLGLPLEIQSVFVWFVMLFPIGLVTAFFLVLLFKHKVLYAPSDFVDESNFMNLLQNKKVQNELIEVVDLLEQVKESNTANEQLKHTLTEAMLKLENAKLNNKLNSKEIMKSSGVKRYYHKENLISAIFDVIIENGEKGVSLKMLSDEIGLGIVDIENTVNQLFDEGLLLRKNGKYYKV